MSEVDPCAGRNIDERLEQGIVAEGLGVVAIGVAGQDLVDLLREEGFLGMLHELLRPWVRQELRQMGYKLEFERLTSGPINAIYFDRAHGTFWGGSSNHGEDYGIAW